MFRGLFNQPRYPIGIDVGTHSVRMMQIDRQDDRLTVLAAAHRELTIEPGGCGEAFHQEVSQVIRHMLDETSFHGNLVVSCLPSSVVHYKNLRLPMMPPDELPAAIQWEASDRLHLGEPTATQYFDAGRVHQGDDERQEVILLAATNTVVDQHTRAMLEAGLEPVAIDVIPAALARCFHKVSDDHKPHVMIDVGYAQSKVLICQNNRVLFFKQIDIGGWAFDQAVMDHLKINRREAGEVRRNLDQRDDQVRRSVHEAVRSKYVELSREIGLCLRYYSVTFRGERSEHAILMGGEANQSDLAEVIREGAAIEVVLPEPLQGLDLSRVSDVFGEAFDQSEWSVAMGLALHPMGKPIRKRGAA